MTEAQWDRNARCLKHFRHYMNRMTREYEYINSQTPTIIHKATNKETEYYENILNQCRNKTRYFNPLRTN